LEANGLWLDFLGGKSKNGKNPFVAKKTSKRKKTEKDGKKRKQTVMLCGWDGISSPPHTANDAFQGQSQQRRQRAGAAAYAQELAPSFSPCACVFAWVACLRWAIWVPAETALMFQKTTRLKAAGLRLTQDRLFLMVLHADRRNHDNVWVEMAAVRLRCVCGGRGGAGGFALLSTGS
jgi:hypothetical protein